MTGPEQEPPARAREVFVASLQPRPGGRLLRSARFLAAFAAELAMGFLPGPSLSDVVVTRRSDGAELMRVPAGDPLVPGDMLALVQRQLDELSPDAFLAEWGAAAAA